MCFENVDNIIASFEPTNFKGALNVCPVCGYSSIDIRNFKRHLLIHSGEHRFKCDICNRSFSRKEHLKRHAYIHIRNDSYYCKQCNRDFMYKEALRNHMETMHAAFMSY